MCVRVEAAGFCVTTVRWSLPGRAGRLCTRAGWHTTTRGFPPHKGLDTSWSHSLTLENHVNFFLCLCVCVFVCAFSVNYKSNVTFEQIVTNNLWHTWGQRFTPSKDYCFKWTLKLDLKAWWKEYFYLIFIEYSRQNFFLKSNTFWDSFCTQALYKPL